MKKRQTHMDTQKWWAGSLMEEQHPGNSARLLCNVKQGGEVSINKKAGSVGALL